MKNSNTSRYKVQEADFYTDDMGRKPWGRKVYVTRQGKRFAEGIIMSSKPSKRVSRLHDTVSCCIETGDPMRTPTFLNIKTGLIFQILDKSQTKTKSGIRKAMGKLKGIIRANFGENEHSELHVTLTYAENMTDTKKLFSDFKSFFKRLCYAYPNHKFDYISVAEPQGRGAWHMHMLLKSDQPILYIPNEKMEKIWRHGYTTTDRIKADDVGAYFIAYFTDTYSTEKGRTKGARLPFYPSGMRFYRCTGGIIRPKQGIESEFMLSHEYGEATYKKAVDIVDTEKENEVIQHIEYITYSKGVDDH